LSLLLSSLKNLLPAILIATAAATKLANIQVEDLILARLSLVLKVNQHQIMFALAQAVVMAATQIAPITNLAELPQTPHTVLFVIPSIALLDRLRQIIHA
jgi:hypothetical protein